MGGILEMTFTLEQLIGILLVIVPVSIWLIRLEGKVKESNTKFALLIEFREKEGAKIDQSITNLNSSIEEIKVKTNEIMIYLAECGIHPRRRKANGK